MGIKKKTKRLNGIILIQTFNSVDIYRTNGSSRRKKGLHQQYHQTVTNAIIDHSKWAFRYICLPTVYIYPNVRQTLVYLVTYLSVMVLSCLLVCIHKPRTDKVLAYIGILSVYYQYCTWYSTNNTLKAYQQSALDHLFCNHFSRKVQKSGLRNLV